MMVKVPHAFIGSIIIRRPPQGRRYRLKGIVELARIDPQLAQVISPHRLVVKALIDDVTKGKDSRCVRTPKKFVRHGSGVDPQPIREGATSGPRCGEGRDARAKREMAVEEITEGSSEHDLRPLTHIGVGGPGP